MDRQYLIGTGFWTTEEDGEKNMEFLDVWWLNTREKLSNNLYVVVNCSDVDLRQINIDEISIHNLGHIGRPPVIVPDDYELDGWAMSVLMSALAAYAAKADFIYKEQDCLAFGDWVGELYRELDAKNAQMLVGKINSHIGLRGQSLFIVKHGYIPRFIKEFISVSIGHCSKKLLGEQKFDRMMQYLPWMQEMDIGYDRMRPASWDEPIYYVQQLTDDELKQLKEKGLI